MKRLAKLGIHSDKTICMVDKYEQLEGEGIV